MLLLGIVAAAVVLYGAAAAAMYLFQRDLLYAGWHMRRAQPAPRLPEGAEIWRQRHAQGHTEAIWLPATEVPGPRPVVIYAHGNALFADDLLGFPEQAIAPYHRMGVSVLLVEYRGYNRSGGEPSQEAIVADMRAFYRRLVARPDVDRARLIYHGRSLGGAFAAQLAAHATPAALIVESTFSSVADLAHDRWMPGFLARDALDTAEVLRGYKGPLWLSHGSDDEIIPIAHAERLAAARPDVTLRRHRCGHNGCPERNARYWTVLAAWLRTQGVLPER